MIEKGFKLLDFHDGKIAWITTASKGTKKNDGYLDRHRNMMIDKGLNFEEIDIEGKSKKELEAKFKNTNLIFMEGGIHSIFLTRSESLDLAHSSLRSLIKE